MGSRRVTVREAPTDDEAAELLEQGERLKRLCEEGRTRRFASSAAHPTAKGALPGPTGFRSDVFPLPGIVVSQFIRCGKRGCRCENGDKHGPYHYRVWREGKVKKVYVAAVHLEAVKVQCALYETYRLELHRLVQERDAIVRRLQEARQMRRKLRVGIQPPPDVSVHR